MRRRRGEADATNWKWRCQALGNAVVPACARAAFLHLVLGDSGRVSFPCADLTLAGASSESQADALASWMRGSEDALSAALAEGLQDVWRSSARAAVAAKGAAPAKATQQLPAGAMLDGEIWELTPLTRSLPQFKPGPPEFA